MRDWQNSGDDDQGKREALYRDVRALERVRQELATFMADGQAIAAKAKT